MKVLFILEYYYPNIGGVEKLFKDLTENLVEAGYEVEVITTKFNKDLASKETVKGVRIRRLNLKNRFLFTFFSVFFIIRKAYKFDIIHTTSYNAAFPAWLASKILRKKSIITFHEVWGNLWNHLPFLKKYQKFLYSTYENFILKLKFDHYIAVSDFTRKKLIEAGISENKIYRIYNGIDPVDYQINKKETPSNFTFTFFGRLGVSKGLDLILPAAAMFTNKYPKASFKLIIPTIPKALYHSIIDQIEVLGFKDRINIMHHLTFQELKKEIVSSNCVLIPSYSEGFCFAAVETVALNTPIITSGKGALSETVSGKYIQMESFNADGIYKALERAYHNDFDVKEKKSFLLKDSIEQYIRLYERVNF